MTGPCATCSLPVPAAARFCASCGTAVDSSATPTGTAPRVRASGPPASAGTSRGSAPPASSRTRSVTSPNVESSAARHEVSHGRFDPGAILAERYRIVALVGRGGMGEVYRADDMKLGQPVALKFLPQALQGDAERRERFFNEVRMAREVTHQAVCRVHDVGEVDGHLFLSMEYVDGEDLGSLLRRIGRLPQDKAVELSRQLCAGLGAAHDKGVLHRDLKPGNVMIDGRGRVRVTDFGLAGLTHGIAAEDVRSGTPAYMSPEQLAGREVTVRSDLYALGLVLYELFTGKRAFDGRTLAELSRQREEPPAEPSSVVAELDPGVERAILRCLETDPADRPQSAMAVAAALPGGDPLAAALAAGETPSPEMVASLAAAEGMAPARAVACAAVVAAAVALVPFLARGLQLPATVPLPRAPAALEDRARDYVRRLGYTKPPADEARGWGLDMDHMKWAVANDKAPDRWKGLPTNDPPFLAFWYRSSPRLLTSVRMSGRVTFFQPPMEVSGMTQVQLDTLGRLVVFFAVPDQVEDPAAGAAPPGDPRPLFEFAGLDFARFRPVPSRWIPDVYADQRAAWEGPYTAREYPVRVETAWYRGRPVYFEIVTPWSRPHRAEPFEFSRRQELGAKLGLAILLVVAGVAGLLARRHLHMGRGDRRGATRIAGFALIAGLASWALEADHVADLGDEMGLIVRGLAWRLLLAAFIWVLYIALEPFVRRKWPRTLVSWTRLLAGRFGDPLVGRDILVGAAGGALAALTFYSADSLPRALQVLPATPWFWVPTDPLLGIGFTIAELLKKLLGSVTVGLAFLLLLLLFRTILRREWLAAAALILLTSGQALFFSDAPWWIVGPAAIVLRLIPIVLTIRFGLLACVSSFVVMTLLCEMPIAADLTSWAGVPATASFIAVAALTLYAFRAATGGRGFALKFAD